MKLNRKLHRGKVAPCSSNTFFRILPAVEIKFVYCLALAFPSRVTLKWSLSLTCRWRILSVIFQRHLKDVYVFYLVLTLLTSFNNLSPLSAISDKVNTIKVNIFFIALTRNNTLLVMIHNWPFAIWKYSSKFPCFCQYLTEFNEKMAPHVCTNRNINVMNVPEKPWRKNSRSLLTNDYAIMNIISWSYATASKSNLIFVEISIGEDSAFHTNSLLNL
jgi:hypothetical protein